MLLADPATDDKQFRPEKVVQIKQVLIKPLAVKRVFELLLFFDAAGAILLHVFVVTFQLNGAQLGVRQQVTLNKHSATDTGTQRQHNHSATVFTARAVTHLGNTGRIRII